MTRSAPRSDFQTSECLLHDLTEGQGLLHAFGADTIPHGNTTLLVHSVGVAGLLKEWQLDRDVVFAGLFHSAYGSESYPGLQLPVGREELRQAIGVRAEELVYLYASATPCSVEHSIRFRSSVWLWSRFNEDYLRIDSSTFTNLMWLYFANAMEKMIRSKHESGALNEEGILFKEVWHRLSRMLGATGIQAWTQARLG